MTTQTKSLAAILALISLSACSPGQQPSIVSEARASTPTSYSSDYGWRTPASSNAAAAGTVFEYQWGGRCAGAPADAHARAGDCYRQPPALSLCALCFLR